MLKKTAAIVGGFWLYAGACFAQTNPGLTYGQVLTPAQWNALFAGKQDTLGYIPLNSAGGVVTGRLVTAPPSSTTSGFNTTPGSTPASPVNGDWWVTSSGAFVRVNGVTIGPIGGATGSSFAGTSPIKVTFPSGVVTYAFDFTIANTFLAQQTGQGATTTQPGWYAQLVGDTTARVRVGLNATDVPSLAFGSGSAARDLLLERAGPAALRLGSTDAAAPVAQTVGVQNVASGTSNTAGAAFTVAGSQGTGTGLGGDILFKTAPAGSAGSAQNALVTAGHIYGSGGIAIGASATDPGVGNLNLGGGALWNNGTAPTGTGAYVRSASPALSGTIAGNFSLSGNITHTGQGIFAGTSPAASAAGNTNIAGTLASVPTLTSTGQANLFNTTVGGAIIQGDGSTDDFRLYNKSGGLALNLPTGTTVPQLPGLASGTCVNGLGLDSSNNIVKDACPGAASSIQQGAGGTTVTSANGTGRLLTEGTVSGGTGLLTDVPATIDSSGNLASVNSIAGSVIATKAQQQSASAANLIVTPSQQQSHDSAAKATCLFNGTITGTNACLGGVSFNVTNLTRNSAGNYTANFTTPFATFVSSIPTFGCVAYPLSNAGSYTSEGLTPTVPGTFNFLNLAAGVATDVSLEMLVCYGRQ